MNNIKEKIGLYFGSFNPIHIGHLILANHIIQNYDLDKIWFVVSPQNPLKNKVSLEEDKVRLYLVKAAIENNPKLFACDAEFFLPKPSYTINTLNYLEQKYKACGTEFSIIMGEDNLKILHKWKDYEKILNNYNIFVYPRMDNEAEEKSENNPYINHINVHLVDAPMINISSSYIRNLIRNNKSIQYLVTDRVFEEIQKKGLYRQ